MFVLLLVLALEAPANLPEEVPACRCLEGQPCQCDDCRCEWQRYLNLREEAIRRECWLIVAVGGAEPAAGSLGQGNLVCRVKSFEKDSTPRIILSYGAQGELWRYRPQPRGGVIQFSSSTRATFTNVRAASSGNC